MAQALKKCLRSNAGDIFLVGKSKSEILGAKLPSMKQVLQVFFHKLRVEKFSVKQSAGLAIDLVIPFWEKARIPIQAKRKCVSKLEKLYSNWVTLHKNSNKQCSSYLDRKNEFRERIDNYIFDIATSNALESLTNEEDRDFLLQQRQKGRPGIMLGTDRKLAIKEERKRKRMEAEHNRTQKHLETLSSGIVCNNLDRITTNLSTYFVNNSNNAAHGKFGQRG